MEVNSSRALLVTRCTLVVAPVFWATGSPIIAYKVYLVLSLALNGLMTHAILRRRRVGFWLSCCGGLIMLGLPIVHQQLEVSQLIPVWGILWTWNSSARLGHRPTLWRGVEAGLAFGVSFMLSIHHGLFLALLLTPSIWPLVQRWTGWKTWVSYMIALTVAAAFWFVGDGF